jgi:hypothetical protein
LGHQGQVFRQLRYPTSPEKIANRTVADEYFAVSEKSKPSTDKAIRYPPTRSGRAWLEFTLDLLLDGLDRLHADRRGGRRVNRSSS